MLLLIVEPDCVAEPLLPGSIQSSAWKTPEGQQKSKGTTKDAKGQEIQKAQGEKTKHRQRAQHLSMEGREGMKRKSDKGRKEG